MVTPVSPKSQDGMLAVPRSVRAMLVALGVAVGILWSLPGLARANGYTGLLYGGTLSFTSNGQSESGGYVYGSDSWTAPNGVVFNGFAYTSASFSSVSDNSVGGVSAGFGGDGSANQPSIVFPWTADCSITNGGHFWTNSNGTTLAGTNGKQTCNSSGDASGWNYANSELENTNPGIDPQTDYHTLWLTVFCQAGTCNYDPNRQWGNAGVSVTNLSGSFQDSNGQPTGGASWGLAVSTNSWYQSNGNGLTLNLSAQDPAGVCALYGRLAGPSTVTGGVVGNQGVGVVNVGGPIGEEFQTGTNPCWTGQTDRGTWTVPGGIASGTYAVNVLASNPGNYQSQGFSATNSPTVATYNNAINIDDTTPTVSWDNAAGGWTSQTNEQLDVTVGPSGVSSVLCTDNGSSIPATLVSGSSSGAGTSVWSVPTQVNGDNDVACAAGNGDANGALTASVSRDFSVDTTVPTVSFVDSGYTRGSWINAPQTVGVDATGGPSGVSGINCTVNGTQVAIGADDTIAMSGSGQYALGCTATSNTGIQGSATYNVNIDTEQPTLTFLVNGDPPTSAYQSGTPVVTVIGSEAGGILSGLSQISCSVNGGSPISLSGIDATSDYTGSFELDQNGADHVSCTGTSVAGTVQATPSTVTVNVDNPNYAPNASSLIDNGADPYSNGPSQSQWYVTPQSVTITADNTGGTAPIASISCKGALSGSWPIDKLNADSKGGEQITVTVPAPGGDLSCAAEDSAGNVYVLGSYLFQIDATPPKGYFMARSNWPQPDAITIHATDNGGSGVALVKVYGQSPDVEQGAPQLVGDARYDSSIRAYVVSVPDGVAPWVAGSWKFYANVVDVAGNQGQITAGSDGSTEDLTLPLREDTAVSATSEQVAATPDVAIPDSLATAALPRRGRLRYVQTAPRPGTASVARARARSIGHALTVSYGSAITITGMLKDVTHRGIPISGARILVYEQLVGARRYLKLGTTRTNAQGDYRYRVKPGASRTLYVLYPGNTQLRPAASQLLEHSTGSLMLAASSIRAGGKLLITGQVRGGHIPRDGLDVTIDYRQVGAPGSGTLGTVRTSRTGEFRFIQYFSPSTRGLTYEVWAVVPGGQSGWPYLGASTPRVARRVS